MSESRVNADHIIKVSGKDFVTYEGLLELAHQDGLKRIATTVIQLPHPDNGNVCVVAAEVETSKGIFSGIGDCSPANTSRMIAPHSIRMAETRAKARAMRDAVNVGITAFEELGDTSGDDTRRDNPTKPPTKPTGNPSAEGQNAPKLSVVPPSEVEQVCQAAAAVMDVQDAAGRITDAQAVTIRKLCGLLGRAEPEGLDRYSKHDAGVTITDLSGEYNRQRKAGER